MSKSRRIASEHPVAAVLALTALALVLRLVALGERTVHWDEARVAYWTLRSVRGAGFVYRPIIHGPFLPLVVAPLFELLGPTSFAARLPVALVGGIAPLAALLFRRPTGANAAGLSNEETVALATLLAVLPGFVYYSRFMRSDVLLAVFGLVAVGFGSRALLTGRRRYVVAAGLFVGLALTTKENVLLYLACAGGAVVVAVCWPAVVAWHQSADPGTRLADALASAVGHLRRHLPAVPFALLAALLPVVFFFAPRAAAGDPTLGGALAGEAPWPALVERTTLGTWETFRASLWADSGHGAYGEYAWKLGAYLLVGALPAVVGASVAVAEEIRSPSRPLVVPFVAWGVASVLGYPLAADIPAPWLSVHLALPLLVPAAVGWVVVAEKGWLRPSEWVSWSWWRGHGRSRRVALAALVVLSVVHVPAVLAVSSVTPPLQANVLAQTAQPADDLNPLVATIDDAADDGGVLYYGDAYDLPTESVADHPPQQDAAWLGTWLNRLPMAWYVERAEAPTVYAADAAALTGRESLPPVVFAAGTEADDVASTLADRGYSRTRYDLGLYHEESVVVFVDQTRLDGE